MGGEKISINKKICKNENIKEKNFTVYSLVIDWLGLANGYKETIILENYLKK